MDDRTNTNLLEKIKQYQNSIIKHSDNGNDERILAYIKKLYDMPITVEHLKQTGVGRTMNSLRKYSGPVGVASKAIVAKWKTMVANEEDEEVEEVEPVKPQYSPVEVEILSPDSPIESPSSPLPEIEEKKIKSHRKEEKHSKREESREKHRRHESSSHRSKSRSDDKERDRHSKSHHRREEKNSHKSSHKERDRDHKHKKHDDKHRREEKRTHENKRKHEEDKTPSKKTKYDYSEGSDDSNRLTVDNISISSMNSDDIFPDSTTTSNDIPEIIIESPILKEKKSKHEKHRSSDKNKQEVNGSSKKSSHKDKEKHEEKDRKSSKDSKKSSSSKSKKVLLNVDNGIDSGSGASFAEALGMIEPTTKSYKKKSSSPASPTPSSSTTKSSKSTPSSSKPRTQSPLTQNPILLSPHAKLEPLDNIIIPQLPEITTNYKPLGLNYDASPSGPLKHLSEEEALSVVISSKTQRTKVFSGNKTNWGYVPSLFQLCVRILQDNIDALEYTGGVPYEILKPVLERASANQLLNTEYYNPYLVEEDDELWELHCRRECKGMKRQELETWREMYLRCRDERATKLKMLTVNIKQSIDKSVPVRQTKLAYVDSFVKPPRGIARKQAKYGTSHDTHKRPLITPTQRLNSIASSSGGEKISVPTPSPRAVSASAIKPKKAPLMQKTLALMKGRFGRR